MTRFLPAGLVAGKASGGFLIAALGAARTMTIDALSYLLALVLLRRLPVMSPVDWSATSTPCNAPPEAVTKTGDVTEVRTLTSR